MIKGGVLADAVGYGKTAITLGLIDANRGNEPKMEVAAPPICPPFSPHVPCCVE